MRFAARRLLFLDFDGVLHPTDGHECRPFCHAGLLLECLEGADCRVVISSSWRHHHNLPSLLARLPGPLAERVVGTTGPAHIGRWPRYHEILAYLQRHGAAADWRALDDSVIEFPPRCPGLIACHPNVGLGPDQCQALRTWLALPGPPPK